MTTNYTVSVSPAIKNTITITRRQLWTNFVNSWRDMAWDEYETFKDFTILKQVGEILCQGELTWKVRTLFRDGHTYMLMGDAMDIIDNNDPNSYCEIVVVDGDTKVIVEESDIDF